MKPSYIYPEWGRAKSDLIKALMATDRKNIPEVVYKWFESHVFEVGATNSVSRMELERANTPQDLLKHEEQRSFYKLADTLRENGLYTVTAEENLVCLNRTYRVLVFGAPKLLGREHERGSK
jgi:hypothetical protein